MKTTPPSESPSSSSGATPSGLGGISPPSHHVSHRAGHCSPRAGNRYRTMLERGKFSFRVSLFFHSLLKAVGTLPSTATGYLRFRAQKGTSSRWQPMSPADKPDDKVGTELAQPTSPNPDLRAPEAFHSDAPLRRPEAKPADSSRHALPGPDRSLRR